MGKVYLNDYELTNIGEAIREKTQTSSLLLPSQMPDMIRSIQSGTWTPDDLEYPHSWMKIMDPTPNSSNDGHTYSSGDSINLKFLWDNLVALYIDCEYYAQMWHSNGGIWYMKEEKNDIALQGKEFVWTSGSNAYKAKSGEYAFYISKDGVLTGKYEGTRGTYTDNSSRPIGFVRTIAVYTSKEVPS